MEDEGRRILNISRFSVSSLDFKEAATATSQSRSTMKTDGNTNAKPTSSRDRSQAARLRASLRPIASSSSQEDHTVTDNDLLQVRDEDTNAAIGISDSSSIAALTRAGHPRSKLSSSYARNQRIIEILNAALEVSSAFVSDDDSVG